MVKRVLVNVISAMLHQECTLPSGVAVGRNKDTEAYQQPMLLKAEMLANTQSQLPIKTLAFHLRLPSQSAFDVMLELMSSQWMKSLSQEHMSLYIATSRSFGTSPVLHIYNVQGSPHNI
jgi:hypothetical protein